ncbi:hypothetical protein Lal_00035337 [Lupinus albus]|nr:hypothetical protein Lal_00035337 [Lupinus albus]
MASSSKTKRPRTSGSKSSKENLIQSPIPHKFPLPYAIFITNILEHFGVSLDGETKVALNLLESKIDIEVVDKMGFSLDPVTRRTYRGNTGHLHPINPEIDRTYHRLVRQSRNLPFHSVPDSISDSIPISVHSVQYTDFVHSVALSDFEHSENSVHSENMAQPPTPPGHRETTLAQARILQYSPGFHPPRGRGTSQNVPNDLLAQMVAALQQVNENLQNLNLNTMPSPSSHPLVPPGPAEYWGLDEFCK